MRKNAFFNFLRTLFFRVTTRNCRKGWSPDEAVLESFHDYLMKQNVQFTEADWARDHALDSRSESQAEMYITAFSYEDSSAVDGGAGSGSTEGH